MGGYVEFKKENVIPLLKKMGGSRKDNHLVYFTVTVQPHRDFLLEISPRGKKAKIHRIIVNVPAFVVSAVTVLPRLSIDTGKNTMKWYVGLQTLSVQYTWS